MELSHKGFFTVPDHITFPHRVCHLKVYFCDCNPIYDKRDVKHEALISSVQSLIDLSFFLGDEVANFPG